MGGKKRRKKPINNLFCFLGVLFCFFETEIIGLVPMEALIDTASYYLGLEDFSMNQVLEARIME